MTAAVQPATEHGPVTIAGRTFRQHETTSIAQDAYTMKRYRASGLADIARRFDPATDDLPAYSERILWEGLDSGIVYEILGGILVEDGTTWSRQSAERNALLFAGLTTPADKQVVYDRLADVLHDFLVVAAVSKLTFEKSLPPLFSKDRQHDGDPASDAAHQTEPTPRERAE